MRYEGYGPGGVAIMVACTTDNRTRTVGEVRHALAKYGGNLGQDGSVAFLFKRQGVISFPPGADEDRIMELALDAGAEDVVTSQDGTVDVLTSPDDFPQVRDAIQRAGIKPEVAELSERATTSVTLDGEDAERMLKLLELLEDLDDVQNVYTNADFPETILERQAG